MRRARAIAEARGGILLACLLLGACGNREAVAPDPLIAVLAKEKAAALAADRFGAAGGKLVITSGAQKGVVFTVPPGALSADTVISIYPAESVDVRTGFRSVGPAVEVRAVGGHLVNDAVAQLPFHAEAVTGPLNRVVLLRVEPAKITALAGVHVLADRDLVRGPTRSFGGFQAAVDADEFTPRDDAGPSFRCPFQAGWNSLQTAVGGLRILARASMSDAELYGALAPDADGCGVAFNWEVVWFSPTTGRTESYSFAATGVTGPLAVGAIGCPAVAFQGSGDSTGMSNDFAVRFGTTPQTLRIEVLNCDSVANPPRVRLTAGGTVWYGDYSPSGNFLSKNF